METESVIRSRKKLRHVQKLFILIHFDSDLLFQKGIIHSLLKKKFRIQKDNVYFSVISHLSIIFIIVIIGITVL